MNKFNSANDKINNGFEVKSEKRFGFINKLWLNKMKKLLKEYNIDIGNKSKHS